MTSSVTITTETRTKTRIRRREVTHPAPDEIAGHNELHSTHLSESTAVFEVAERVYEEESLDLVRVTSTTAQGAYIGDFWEDSEHWSGRDKRYATKTVMVSLGMADITFWFASEQDQARRKAAESVCGMDPEYYADQGELKEKPKKPASSFNLVDHNDAGEEEQDTAEEDIEIPDWKPVDDDLAFDEPKL